MEELNEVMEDETFHIVKVRARKPYSILNNKILLNPSIDYYTLGVYSKLQALYEEDKNWEELYKYGSKEYVDKALKKLEEYNYLKIKEGKLYF